MSLLTYSGITTKVRAMESRLFTEEQFREMAALEDVHSAADYLKQQPAYAGIFSGLDDSMLHRGNIERLLTLSLYRDFAQPLPVRQPETAAFPGSLLHALRN